MIVSLKSVAVVTLGAFLLSITAVRAQLSWSSESSDGFTGRAGLAAAAVGQKIYVFGGATSITSDGTNILEIFDASSGTWSTPTVTGTPAPRNGAAAVAVDDKIYVVGGNDPNSSLPSFEVFDTKTSTWSAPASTGTFTPRYAPGAVVLDGKIYVIGGGGPGLRLSTVEVLDIATHTWSTPATTGTFTPRQSFAVAVVDGKIYAIGGNGETGSLNSVEMFDPATSHWSTVTTTGAFNARFGITAVAAGSAIYVLGNRTAAGSFVDVLDTRTNSWSTPPTSGSVTPRTFAASSQVANKIYVMGGVAQNGSVFTFLNTNESLTLGTSGADIEAATQGRIRAYPNPSRGVITVRGSSSVSRVVVADALGTRIIDVSPRQPGDVRLDLSTLARGRYYLRIVASGAVTTTCVVLE